MTININLVDIKYPYSYSSDSEDYESATEELVIKRNENLFNVEDFPPELGVYILKKLNDVALVKMREVSYEWKRLIDSNTYLSARIAVKYFTSRVDKEIKDNILDAARLYTDLAELDASYYMKAKTAVKNYEGGHEYFFDKFTLKIIKIEMEIFQNLNAAIESFNTLKCTSNKIKACKKFPILQSEPIKDVIFHVPLDKEGVVQGCSYFLKLNDLDSALRLHEKYPNDSGCIIKILKKYPYHLNNDKTNESFDPKLVQTIQNLYQKIICFYGIPVDFHINNLRIIAKHSPKKAEQEALALLERKIDFSLESSIVMLAVNADNKLYFRNDDIGNLICFIAEINPILGLKMLKDFLSNLNQWKDDANLILKIQFAIAKITKDFSTFSINNIVYHKDIFNQLFIHNPVRAFQIVDSQEEYSYGRELALQEISYALKNKLALEQILEIPGKAWVSDHLNYFELNRDLNFLMESFKQLEEVEDKYKRPKTDDYIKGARLAKSILDTYKET